MKTVSLSRDMVHAGNLILVNREYPCRGARETCRPVGQDSGSIFLTDRFATIYTRLMDELSAWDQILPVSGWRSKQEQEQIYRDCISENGAEFTSKYVAFPGHSEHQTGLALDLALNQPDIDAICPHFPYTGMCGTFREKAVHYGLVERYPDGKEGVTGIANEPWHFRYVGVPHAALMEQNGFTLEEYLSWLRMFPYGGEPLRYGYGDKTIEIFYLSAGAETTLFEVEEGPLYTVSGDNINGFIITVWKENHIQ